MVPLDSRRLCNQNGFVVVELLVVVLALSVIAAIVMPLTGGQQVAARIGMAQSDATATAEATVYYDGLGEPASGPGIGILSAVITTTARFAPAGRKAQCSASGAISAVVGQVKHSTRTFDDRGKRTGSAARVIDFEICSAINVPGVLVDGEDVNGLTVSVNAGALGCYLTERLGLTVPGDADMFGTECRPVANGVAVVRVKEVELVMRTLTGALTIILSPVPPTT